MTANFGRILLTIQWISLVSRTLCTLLPCRTSKNIRKPLDGMNCKNIHIYVSAFITGLLHNIGTHVDPIILIQKIREGLEIPGLRDSLVKILQDYNLQVGARSNKLFL